MNVLTALFVRECGLDLCFDQLETAIIRGAFFFATCIPSRKQAMRFYSSICTEQNATGSFEKRTRGSTFEISKVPNTSLGGPFVFPYWRYDLYKNIFKTITNTSSFGRIIKISVFIIN